MALQTHSRSVRVTSRAQNTEDSVKDKASYPILSCKKCTNGNKITVNFSDGEFNFHSQWLHDARCDHGASRNAITAISQQPAETVRVLSSELSYDGRRMTLNVAWNDGMSSKFPVEWLRVMAPLVAMRMTENPTTKTITSANGWIVETLKIPEISYKELFDIHAEKEQRNALTLSVLDHLLSPSSPGLIKVVDLPEPNVSDELNHVNNLNTAILKKIFGQVFVHPARGADKSFNVSSRSSEVERRNYLPNYDTKQLLLPHTDHAFYENPIQVQGWYILEGESENTFVSVVAALKTLKKEFPKSYDYLCNTPMTFGRSSTFYGKREIQMTVDTVITMQPGTQDQFKRVRWHPNLVGSLLCSYEDYMEARLAHRRFQEIVRRDTHQLKTHLKPGDMFIWDNFRILHGRERVFSEPRTGVGQTVPQQVVHDKYRALCIDMLDGLVDDHWLVHLPMPQLREMVRLVQDRCYRPGDSTEASVLEK